MSPTYECSQRPGVWGRGSISNERMVVGLDAGAFGITVAVYNPLAEAGQKLVGVGFSPAVGFDNGSIINMNDAVGSLRRAVADAELATGTNISFVFAGVDIPGMLVQRLSRKITFPGGKVFKNRDLLELRRDIFNQSLPDGYSIIQPVNVWYYVDGEPADRLPGNRGRDIQVEAVVIAADGDKTEQIYRCFNEAGLRIKQAVAGPLAAAEAVLDAVERELGVLLVDIGACMTRAAYINQGIINAMQVFPIGSGHITSDLALVLHTTLEQAEDIKINYGLTPVEGTVSVRSVAGGDKRSVPGELAHRVLCARVEEILEFINNFIHDLHLSATLPGGVVITGGGALLTGLAEMAGKYLDMPVRVGSSRLLADSMVPVQEAYRYTNAVGLALWGTGQTPVQRGVKEKLGGGIIDRIREWIQ